MSLGKLDILKQHHPDLLLAEVAALLHDIGKFCNLHIEAHAEGGTKKWANGHAYKAIVDTPTSQIGLSSRANSHKKPDALKNILKAGNPKAADFLDNSLKDFLTNNSLTISGETYTLAELIMLGTPGFATARNRPALLDGKPGWLAAVLGVCHSEAHVDKQDPARGEGKQTWPHVFISSAFGFEKEKVVVDASPNSLDARLKNLQVQSGREALLNELAYGLGDTRRPVNEVLLSDWGWIVAALFKSALAGALIKNQQFSIRQQQQDRTIDHDLRWRILRVNFDVLGLYAKAVKIADLLGYQRVVTEACEQIKQLLEDEYPLGNEIYRDTTGIYFTFPNLDLPDEPEQEIRRRVEQVEPELAPRIAVTLGKNNTTAQEQLKSILDKARQEAQNDLAQPFDARNLGPCWQQLWETVGAGRWEVCPVCRLRPKRESAEVCEHCEKRRASRLDTWRGNPDRTIWIGEIADHNDRVALLVGKFGLKDWLSGEMVQTMLVTANPATNTFTPKNPSPARLRRVWETCQRFWDGAVLQDILSKALANRGLRKHIIPNRTHWQAGLYNGKINGKPLDLFWQPDHNAFLTISNLQAAGELKQGDTISLEHPETKQKTEFQIQAIRAAPAPFDRYQAFLPLPASPDQFLAFVPAADAPEILQNISTAYQEQFGKVRNRLPLALGLVYFPRKIPLMAVMDAARQMLNAPLEEDKWELAQDVANGCVQFKNGITWNVSTVMGDNSTPDEWYPYYFVTQADSIKHPRRFQLRKEGDTDPQKVGSVNDRYADRWLVHVNDLKQGDKVHLTPSTFDFEFLDAAARRFEIHYDKDGRRPRPTRPFYLEDLERFDLLWQEIRHLSKTQLKQILQTIETARERWFGPDGLEESAKDQTFRQFAEDTLATAQWDWKAIPQEQRNQLVTAAARGVLTDLAELHLEILKEDLQEDKSQGETP